ncbi:hypothetical protein FLAG1_10666 [Fusarium langsethiae]|uniref:Uncharacterized protein n=1 Tax=Fusarium langsethiae TaxID=179993 RepID=A0A0M9ENA4_FUSLA|nr:hypothetical protein FLAG1_10666 [Fusarium langsethiae]
MPPAGLEREALSVVSRWDMDSVPFWLSARGTEFLREKLEHREGVFIVECHMLLCAHESVDEVAELVREVLALETHVESESDLLDGQGVELPLWSYTVERNTIVRERVPDGMDGHRRTKLVSFWFYTPCEWRPALYGGTEDRDHLLLDYRMATAPGRCVRAECEHSAQCRLTDCGMRMPRYGVAFRAFLHFSARFARPVSVHGVSLTMMHQEMVRRLERERRGGEDGERGRPWQ